MASYDAAVILTSGHAALVTISGDTLAQLQGLVGGLIEGVPLGDNAYGYANEEGLLDGLLFNRVATALRMELNQATTADPAVWGLVGRLVICGPSDGEGGDTSITPEVLALVKERCRSFFDQRPGRGGSLKPG